MSGESVWVVAAHPDDEVLGCGGAIARHIEEGDSVKIAILGEGIAARMGLSMTERQHQQRELYDHVRLAHKVLGAGEPTLRQFPDNQFDSVPLLEVIREVEKILNEVRPTLVYTHHPGDVNVDHRIVSQAIEAAIRPMEGGSVREVRAFEIASSSEWNFVREPFKPNVFVSLTEKQLKAKIDSMRKYTSEYRDFPHPRSAEYLEALARVRGGQSGYRAAEAFELIFRRL